MSEREQYGKLADELEDRADALADQNEGLGKRIAGVREDWERTRAEIGGTPDWDDPDDDEADDDEDPDLADDDDDEGDQDEDD
jgi:hypothetical protein